MQTLTLVSHHLCPYVQRIAIALAEQGMDYQRRYVDLAAKPDWFKALSPLGKTPVLLVGDAAIFESAVILECLEETGPHPLHPADPLRRAEHRGLIEYGSAILNDIAGLYAAPDAAAFTEKQRQLAERFAWLEQRLGQGPWYAGARFTLVDAAFAPVFRYFSVFDRIGDFANLGGLPKLARWRAALAARPSVQAAVTEDYESRLRNFLLARRSHISQLIQAREAA